MTVEKCDLLHLDGQEFASDITIRWSKKDAEGDLLLPCRDLLTHGKEPASFILRFHRDRKTQQVSTDACPMNEEDKVVRVVASGPRRW
jgi:hypothetical protein